MTPAGFGDWIEIESPDEEVVWRLDAAFLMSSWRCIYGNGCRGIHASQDPLRADGCCTVGAQLTDAHDFTTVTTAARRLDASQWQHKSLADRKNWFKRRANGTVATRVVDGGCIFLNRPGFPGGPGCALHRGALDAGQHPVEWKPYVCWQLPLRREDLVEDGRAVAVLRRWTITDWGTDGANLNWWCTEAAEAFTAAAPVWQTLSVELRAVVGDAVYRELVDHLTMWQTQGPCY